MVKQIFPFFECLCKCLVLNYAFAKCLLDVIIYSAKKQKTIQIVDLPPLPPKQRNNTAQRPTVQNNQSPLKKRNIVGQKNVNSTPKKKPRERRLAHPKPGKMGKKLKKLLNR